MRNVLALLCGIVVGWWLRRRWERARTDRLRAAIRAAWENPDKEIPIPGGQILVRSADPTTQDDNKEVMPNDNYR